MKVSESERIDDDGMTQAAVSKSLSLLYIYFPFVGLSRFLYAVALLILSFFNSRVHSQMHAPSAADVPWLVGG